MADDSTFRRLWRPPGRLADRDPHRSVTFLELFFDLVFVAIIAQLAHTLAERPSWSGVGWFVFLFYAVWSSWMNGTLYHDIHGVDDLSTRLFTFAQMLAVAVMAVYAGDVPGEGASGFAVAYAANTFLLVILWYRTGAHDPSHRPASVPYSIAYFLAGALFAVSALVDSPLIYWLWGLALLSEALGLAVARYRRRLSEPEGMVTAIEATPSLIERMGLFVIIVLGEVVVGAVNGMADIAPLDRDELILGLLGLLVAIALWWVYFDLVSHRAPYQRMTLRWIFLQLPAVIAMAATGAAVLNTVEHAGEPLPGDVRWLLVGSVSVAIGSVVALTFTLEARMSNRALYGVVDRALLVAATLILLVGLTSWGAKGTLLSVVLLLLMAIFAGLRVWAQSAAFSQPH